MPRKREKNPDCQGQFDKKPTTTGITRQRLLHFDTFTRSLYCAGMFIKCIQTRPLISNKENRTLMLWKSPHVCEFLLFLISAFTSRSLSPVRIKTRWQSPLFSNPIQCNLPPPASPQQLSSAAAELPNLICYTTLLSSHLPSHTIPTRPSARPSSRP